MLRFAGLCLQFQLDNHLPYLCIFCHNHHWEMCKTQELFLIFSIIESHLHCLCIVCNNHPWEIYKAQELLLMVPKLIMVRIIYKYWCGNFLVSDKLWRTFHFCELLLHFMYCILSGFDADCCFCCKSVELWMYISRYLGKVLL